MMSRYLKSITPEPIKAMWRNIRKVWHICQRKTFKPYTITKENVEGITFKFWVGDRFARKVYDEDRSPSWPEMTFLRDNLIQPDDVVFECGAHHGFTTILISKWVGEEGRVIAFEPVPHNTEIIQKNIELNHLNNVLLVKKAVGSTKGKVYLSGHSSSSIVKGGGIETDITYVDEYAHFKPTLLKIDVEGYEVEVLKGAKNILATRPKLSIEIHSPASLAAYNSSVEDIFRYIEITKYKKLWVQWDDREKPEEYDIKKPIKDRVHLFALPY
jgi:FkbM family methyltransferase